MLFIFKLQQ